MGRCLMGLMILCLLLSWGPARADDTRPALEKGQKAAPFNLTVVNGEKGESVRLYNLVGRRPRTKAKLVVLNFFATWCKPCKEEMPLLQKIHEQLGPKGVKVYSIMLEGGGKGPAKTQKEVLKEVRAFVKKHKLTFPVLYDEFLKDVVPRNYLGVPMQIPGVYIIDTKGYIVAAYHEACDDLVEKVQKVLDKQP